MLYNGRIVLFMDTGDVGVVIAADALRVAIRVHAHLDRPIVFTSRFDPNIRLWPDTNIQSLNEAIRKRNIANGVA